MGFGRQLRQAQLVEGNVGQHEDLGAAAFLGAVDVVDIRRHLTLGFIG